MEIGTIIQNDLNKILNLDQNLQETRLNICYKCPLYSSRHGGLCDSQCYLNVETGEVSNLPLEGYKNGCGCLLISKTKNPKSICPVGKW